MRNIMSRLYYNFSYKTKGVSNMMVWDGCDEFPHEKTLRQMSEFRFYIDKFYSTKRDYYFPQLKGKSYHLDSVFPPVSFKDDHWKITFFPSDQYPFPNEVMEFNLPEKIELLEYFRKKQIEFKELITPISDLEHVVKFGCTDFISIGLNTYEEKNKPLFYSDEELRYCVRKYGLMKVLWKKFKYNFRRRVHFGIWWIFHIFGLNLYSKDEVTAAVYQACNKLRQGLKPGESLEEKIIQQVENNSQPVIGLPSEKFLSIEDELNQKRRSLPPKMDLLGLPQPDELEFMEKMNEFQMKFEKRREDIKKKIEGAPKKINRLERF